MAGKLLIAFSVVYINKYMKKYLLLILLGMLVILGGIALFVANKQSETLEPRQPEQVEQKSLPPIGIDMSTITPQFVDDREADPKNPAPLPDDMKKVKKAVIDMYVEKEPGSEEFNSRITLLTVDKRYVLIRPAMGERGPPGPPDVLIDTTNGSEVSPGVEYAVQGKNTRIYILPQKISYYKLGQSSFLTLDNSELTPPETYSGSKADLGVLYKETHTDTKLIVMC